MTLIYFKKILVLAHWTRKYDHNLCFEQKYEKYQSSLSEIFQDLEVIFFLNIGRFHNDKRNEQYISFSCMPFNDFQ